MLLEMLSAPLSSEIRTVTHASTGFQQNSRDQSIIATGLVGSVPTAGLFLSHNCDHSSVVSIKHLRSVQRTSLYSRHNVYTLSSSSNFGISRFLAIFDFCVCVLLFFSDREKRAALIGTIRCHRVPEKCKIIIII